MARKAKDVNAEETRAQSIGTSIKRMRDLMRKDAGLGDDTTRLTQLSWILFLKAYDAREQEWEIEEDGYKSIIPDGYKWNDWAVEKKDEFGRPTGESLTGPALINYVNNDLFPTLRSIPIDENTEIRKAILVQVMNSTENAMRDGTLLREVIDLFDNFDFTNANDTHIFNDIYETLVKEQGSKGEYYTPRAVTDFIVQTVDPDVNDTIADFACGTGGFLISAIKYLQTKKALSSEDMGKLDNILFAIEKIKTPYLLCMSNLLLHNVKNPFVLLSNSLETKVEEYELDRPRRGNAPADQYSIIIMNPPYGGQEKDIIKNNFPGNLRSSETADLFVELIVRRLKKNGRAAVILPDGFMFGTDVKSNIKEDLMTKCNLHTVIRMPNDVFAPYTNIRTNILFFDKTGPTKQTWFYRLDKPEGYKHFSKTKPIKLEHFDPAVEWMKNKVEIKDDETDTFKAKCYSFEEIKAKDFNIDLCGFPQVVEEILPPHELIANYRAERAELDKKIDDLLDQLEAALGQPLQRE